MKNGIVIPDLYHCLQNNKTHESKYAGYGYLGTILLFPNNNNIINRRWIYFIIIYIILFMFMYSGDFLVLFCFIYFYFYYLTMDCVVVMFCLFILFISFYFFCLY